jgi:hypothetical protein
MINGLEILELGQTPLNKSEVIRTPSNDFEDHNTNRLYDALFFLSSILSFLSFFLLEKESRKQEEKK